MFLPATSDFVDIPARNLRVLNHIESIFLLVPKKKENLTVIRGMASSGGFLKWGGTPKYIEFTMENPNLRTCLPAAPRPTFIAVCDGTRAPPSARPAPRGCRRCGRCWRRRGGPRPQGTTCGCGHSGDGWWSPLAGMTANPYEIPHFGGMDICKSKVFGECSPGNLRGVTSSFLRRTSANHPQMCHLLYVY